MLSVRSFMGAGRTGFWDTEVITWEVQEKVRTQGGLAPTTDPAEAGRQ